jgi:hypothetical protein
MFRNARAIGIVIAGVGLAVLLGFGGVALHNLDEFRKAQMVHQRNPGNAMYDLQYFVAASQLMFVLAGAVIGGLLALNGATWIALGTAARRLEREAAGRDGDAR